MHQPGMFYRRPRRESSRPPHGDHHGYMVGRTRAMPHGWERDDVTHHQRSTDFIEGLPKDELHHGKL